MQTTISVEQLKRGGTRKRPASSERPPSVLVIGKENVGKTQLLASLTGVSAAPSNFAGATTSCEVYDVNGTRFTDTPGIVRGSDRDTTRRTLALMNGNDTLLAVVQATHFDSDLEDLLPLLDGKHGAIVVTHWDRVQHKERMREVLRSISEQSGVPVLPVNACQLDEDSAKALFAALRGPAPIDAKRFAGHKVGWIVEPRRTWLEVAVLGQALALLMTFLPAILAVQFANALAAVVDPVVTAGLAPVVAALQALPELPKQVVVGPYGLLTMGPLLVVWALPTVASFALILGVYKASGLLERVVVALDPLTRPLGVEGRDIIRVIMGFGCNVPAVVSTRACSGCTRGTCVSAIAFGSACSYQLGATLAVFAASGRQALALPFMVYLLATLIVYTRLTSTPEARSKMNPRMAEGRTFLTLPKLSWVWREARTVIVHFLSRAVPVFLIISAIASVLNYVGVIDVLGSVVAPATRLFGLPGETAIPIVLASIRKDGILLLGQGTLASGLSDGQLLTAVYLSGVLLPCLVTVITIISEMGGRFAFRLVARQAAYALAFSFVLARVASHLYR